MQSCGDSNPHLSGSGVNSCITEWYNRRREGDLCNTAPGEPSAQSWGRMAAVLARPHIDQKRCLGVSFCGSDAWTLVGTAGAFCPRFFANSCSRADDCLADASPRSSSSRVNRASSVAPFPLAFLPMGIALLPMGIAFLPTGIATSILRGFTLMPAPFLPLGMAANSLSASSVILQPSLCACVCQPRCPL